ncbi:hypothetical protein [Azospirillum sp. TSO35-2]|uniref:hypothetical protein n=1 Tax=Azospirillum sp. TSO35-2 TaxID=716796 RepID=UPI000D6050CC|nr:hypothetical protein [Azospirillum sp. TSO35-2]PWC37821.1 hypothetical protein TSO352_10135 [Azospirillum sp. TSO35-2]
MKRRTDTGLTVASTLLLAALAVPGTARAAAVRVQLGDHGDYSRLALVLPDGVEPTMRVDGCVLRISLPEPTRWPLASLGDTWSSRLSDFGSADNGRSLTAAVPCGARVSSLRERRVLIVDVGGPPVPGRKPDAPDESPAMAMPDTPVAEAPAAPAATDTTASALPSPTLAPGLGDVAEALNPFGTAQAAQPPSRPPAATATATPAPVPAPPPAPVIATLESDVRASVEQTLRQLERTPTRAAKPDTPSPAAAEPARPAPPPIGAMDVAAWVGDDFTQTRLSLQRALEGAQGRGRVDAQIALARFLLARAMDEEGRAALEAATSQSPAPDQRYTLRILGDAFRALDGETAPDDNLFVILPPTVVADHHVWRSVALAPTRWTAAREGMPIVLRRLLDYPADLRSRLLTTLAEGADAARDTNTLNLIVLEMITVDAKGMADGRLDYFRGRLAELKGTPDAALDRYDPAAALRRGPFARRAEVRAIELRRSLARLDEDGAIAALEALRFAWRGDDVETDALAALGSAYARSGRTDAALDIFGLLGRRFGATARGRDALAAGRNLLAAVLDRLEQSPPGGLYALALQARHGRLVAQVDDGEAPLRRRLAALLIRDGYSVEATRILHALTETASGPRRAELGAVLARALIDSGREPEALDVLSRTGDPGLEPALAEKRALLRADALLDDGDTMRALDAVRGLPGADAARLRARAMVATGEWTAARTAFADLAADLAATGAEPTAEDVALHGLAASLSGDLGTLQELAETQRGRLTGTRWAGLLDALAPPADNRPLRAESVAGEIATADALDRLVRAWRGRP